VRRSLDPRFRFARVPYKAPPSPASGVSIRPKLCRRSSNIWRSRILALEAFARYSKGGHPAGLNFGDCFAYACAKLAAAPLLYRAL
jgi:hypothetical protein